MLYIMAEVRQKSQESSYLLNMTSAQAEMLERLCKKTGRSKASLLREALNLLLGTYRPVLEEKIDERESVG